MAHHTAAISLKPLLIGACCVALLSSAVKAEDCQSTAPRGAAFTSTGAKSGSLVLALTMLHPLVTKGSKAVVVLRLKTQAETDWSLFSDVPLGDYSLEVYDLTRRQQLPWRRGYIGGISQIGIQHISKTCPIHETVNMGQRYDLKPGSYSVRATRKPERLISWQPRQIVQLPPVVSNEIRFRVDP